MLTGKRWIAKKYVVCTPAKPNIPKSKSLGISFHSALRGLPLLKNVIAKRTTNAPVERISVNRHAGIPDSSTHLETVPFAEKKIAPSTKSNSPRYLVNTAVSLPNYSVVEARNS
jgi:hypothetical protein